jgi:hypothetical protein
MMRGSVLICGVTPRKSGDEAALRVPSAHPGRTRMRVIPRERGRGRLRHTDERTRERSARVARMRRPRTRCECRPTSDAIGTWLAQSGRDGARTFVIGRAIFAARIARMGGIP